MVGCNRYIFNNLETIEESGRTRYMDVGTEHELLLGILAAHEVNEENKGGRPPASMVPWS